MAKIHSILDFIRNFFNPPILQENRSRKRRALDSVDSFTSPKCRRLQPSLSRDFFDLDRENYYMSPPTQRRSSIYKTPPTKIMETIILDEDDSTEVKKFNGTGRQNGIKGNKFTSTPHNIGTGKKNSLNGYDEDVSFVKEFKTTSAKQNEAFQKGLNYIRPFSSCSKFKPRTLQSEKQIKENSRNGQTVNGSSKNLNYSFRPDDKIQYKKLLERSNEDSFYSTPIGKYFKTATRTDRIMSAAIKSPVENSRGRMSTKDTIKKFLVNFENDSVVVKDSDSDSDVVIVNPPSPKPDIKVDPVNSLKKVVDTAISAKTGWLDQLVNEQRKYVAERQKEIKYLSECSEKHGKINKDMRLELLTENINKSLQIRDSVLPIKESEEELELPPLSEAQLKMVNRAFKGDPNEILSQKFNLNITRRDILTLAGLNWLNDEVINFYMNMIIERGKNSDFPKTFAFNTFFYLKLIKDGAQSLRRWTKRVDLFEHDLICIPIHLGMHWCMAIIDFRDKSIRYYDSMGSKNNKCLKALKQYLESEHLDKKKTEYDTSDFELENVKDIPQQMNGSDCGMFSCTFAEFVSRNAKITFSQENMPYLRQKMVVEILSGELLIQ